MTQTLNDSTPCPWGDPSDVPRMRPSTVWKHYDYIAWTRLDQAGLTDDRPNIDRMLGAHPHFGTQDFGGPDLDDPKPRCTNRASVLFTQLPPDFAICTIRSGRWVPVFHSAPNLRAHRHLLRPIVTRESESRYRGVFQYRGDQAQTF